jgi:hypothetical protein
MTGRLATKLEKLEGKLSAGGRSTEADRRMVQAMRGTPMRDWPPLALDAFQRVRKGGGAAADEALSLLTEADCDWRIASFIASCSLPPDEAEALTAFSNTARPWEVLAWLKRGGLFAELPGMQDRAAETSSDHREKPDAQRH